MPFANVKITRDGVRAEQLLLLGLCLAGVLGCGRDHSSTQGRDVQAREHPARGLQGEWVAVHGEYQGEAVEGPDAEAILRKYKFIFEGDSFTTTSADSTTKGTFTVDGSTTPFGMKMLKEDGDEVAAIFEFRNGLLFFCATKPGDPAPEGFKTAPGSSALFTVFKKVQ